MMKKEGNRFQLELEMEANEVNQLHGNMDRIHLFSEKSAIHKTNIAQRGQNEATKYFLIPREMRKGMAFNWSVSCQKIDTPDKVIFVYLVDKARQK